jgi:hypothetical protein
MADGEFKTKVVHYAMRILREAATYLVVRPLEGTVITARVPPRPVLRLPIRQQDSHAYRLRWVVRERLYP